MLCINVKAKIFGYIKFVRFNPLKFHTFYISKLPPLVLQFNVVKPPND